MTHAKFLSVLLLAAICLPFLSMPRVSSQNGTATTTATIETPPAGQCAVLALPFSAPTNAAITGRISTDVPLDFYVMSQNDFSAFTSAGNCQLPPNSYPLFKLIYITRNEYNVRIPANGSYLFVFVYRNNGVTHITGGYVTVNLIFPSSLTFTSEVTSAIIMTYSTVTPELPVWSSWLALVILTGLVGSVMRRKKRVQ